MTFIYSARELKFHSCLSDFVCVPVMYKCIRFSYSFSYLVKVRKQFSGGTPHRTGSVYKGEEVRNSTKLSVAGRTGAFTRGGAFTRDFTAVVL